MSNVIKLDMWAVFHRLEEFLGGRLEGSNGVHTFTSQDRWMFLENYALKDDSGAILVYHETKDQYGDPRDSPFREDHGDRFTIPRFAYADGGFEILSSIDDDLEGNMGYYCDVYDPRNKVLLHYFNPVEDPETAEEFRKIVHEA